LTELSKYATDMKLTTDSSGQYVVTFDVGPKFFEQVLDEAAGTSETEGSTPSSEDQQAAEQLAQTMKDMMAGIQMGVVYKINKSTMLADSSSLKMSMKDAPIVGDMSADMTMNFSNYNDPVTITLPAEAQNAREVQPGPSGIPSIPGMPL
jgi:hypothetical protein